VELRTVKALLEIHAAALWGRAIIDVLDSKADLIESLRTSAWIHATCEELVVRCNTLASSVVMTDSPLKRRLRDVQRVRQHRLTGEEFYGRARQYLGFSADPLDPRLRLFNEKR
jgi:hypothetical protein